MVEDGEFVPDTSAVIEGKVSELVLKGKIKGCIVIHKAVVAEIEHQANFGRKTGFMGLEELKKLNLLKDEGVVGVEFTGCRPNESHIRRARSGEIDALIRDLAWDRGATLITADKVQGEMAKALGIAVIFIEISKKVDKRIGIEDFFDEYTMSIHIKENVEVFVKKGKPGDFKFVKLSDEKLSRERVKGLADEIIEKCNYFPDTLVEIDRKGSSIVQYGIFRIVITRPPFSDGWEITAVRPIKRLELKDYSIDKSLLERFESKAEGVLIAGSPGAGKCIGENESVYLKDLSRISAKELYNSNIDEVLGVDKNGRITHQRIISKHKRDETILYRITLRSGRVITTTENHPLLLFNKDNINWTEVKKVKEGDKIAIVKRLENFSSELSFNPLKYYPPEITLCKISEVDKELPIFYRYIFSKRDILKMLFIKNMGIKELSCRLNISQKHTRRLIRDLSKENVVSKMDGIYGLDYTSFNLKNHSMLLLSDIDELSINKELISHVAVFKRFSSKINWVKLPKEISKELCRLLGYLFSEGGYEKLSFTNFSEELVNDFKECCSSVFGINKNEWKENNLTYYIDWYTSLIPLMKYFNYNLKYKKKSRSIVLPEFLMNCSKECLISFLQAYFEGDGGVSKRGDIEIYTSSETCAKQLIILLCRLGILASLRKKLVNDINVFTLVILEPQSISKFVNAIKPVSGQRKKQIQDIYIKRYSQAYVYDISSLVTGMGFKKKKNVSIMRIHEILNKLLQKYYERYSVIENELFLFRNIIDNIQFSYEFLKNNQNRLCYSLLRENNIDHNSVSRWDSGEKIKIETLKKVCAILNNPICPSALDISNVVASCLRTAGLSIRQVGKECDVGDGTFQYRLSHKWNNSNLKELETTYQRISSLSFKKKKEMEGIIETLKILCDSDLFFDNVKEINILKGRFEVYDFETSNHNFIAGELPILIHNSTFARALANFYCDKGKIVKTVESPRDMDLRDEITQYSKNFGSSEEVHDILLLSRPDYTIFDEVRDTRDFNLYTDLRLSGIGMVGVIHSTSAIEAVQRFIGRLELGVIPSVLDTVIFIDNGLVGEVLELAITVKVPAGMTEADLARPVIEVRDFFSKSVVFEMYSFGEETVVIPISRVKTPSAGIKNIAGRVISKKISGLVSKGHSVDVEVVSDNLVRVSADEGDIPHIIGRNGKVVNELERDFGVSIDVRSRNVEKSKKSGNIVKFNANEDGGFYFFKFKDGLKGRSVNFYGKEDFLFDAVVGRKGIIKFSKKSELGELVGGAGLSNIQVFI